MRAGRTTALAALALLALPAAVLAASGGEGGGGKPLLDLGLRLVNFTALVLLLVYFLRKPIANGIRGSVEGVRRSLLEAEEARKRAEERMRQAQERLSRIDGEVAELLESARREGEVERERVLAEAAQSMGKLKAEVEATVAQEIKRVQAELRHEVAERAVAAAEEALRREIRPEDQRRFIREYLDRLEANRP